MKNAFFPACLFLISQMAFAATSDDFRLEGVMYEPSNEQESLAIVNGQFLKIGDTYQEHKVSEIGADFVILKSEQGGGDVRVNLMGAPIKTATAASDSPKEEAPKKSQKGSKEKGSASGQTPGDAQPKGGFTTSLGAAIGRAADTKVMMDLKQIFMAAANAVSMDMTDESGNPIRENLTLDKLAEMQLLPRNLQEGKSGPYTYRIKSGPNGFEIYADPTDSKSKLRHLMIDQEGAYHAEYGKEATSQSPPP